MTEPNASPLAVSRRAAGLLLCLAALALAGCGTRVVYRPGPVVKVPVYKMPPAPKELLDVIPGPIIEPVSPEDPAAHMCLTKDDQERVMDYLDAIDEQRLRWKAWYRAGVRQQ